MRFLALLLLACGPALAAVSVTDDFGNTVQLPRPATRIVSLAPHLTELLYAAGAGSRVVAAVDYSDFPPEALKLPRVGSEAGIDLEAVIALRPDLVVAWPTVGNAKTIERIASLGLPLFRSEPRELADIATTLERMGTLAGSQDEARRAAASFRDRAARLAQRYGARPKVRAFYQVWDRPIMTVNGEHLISKLIRLCGGENVFAGLPTIAPEIDRKAVLRADPEVIIASGTGAAPPPWLAQWRDWPLGAAARGQLYTIPRDLIQRPTPRVLDGAERLCGILEAVRSARS